MYSVCAAGLYGSLGNSIYTVAAAVCTALRLDSVMAELLLHDGIGESSSSLCLRV